MGVVIRFPDTWRDAQTATEPGEAAMVIILPVVRVERQADISAAPRPTRPSARRRKRPASRS